jgi:hypothetical protein
MLLGVSLELSLATGELWRPGVGEKEEGRRAQGAVLQGWVGKIAAATMHSCGPKA